VSYFRNVVSYFRNVVSYSRNVVSYFRNELLYFGVSSKENIISLLRRLIIQVFCVFLHT
jgi:hypothetical protein